MLYNALVNLEHVCHCSEPASPPCDCWAEPSRAEPGWQEWLPSVRDHSSSAKWPCGAMLLFWTTAAPPSLHCPGQLLGSWGWLDCMASFFISCPHFFSHCCSFWKLDDDGTNSLNPGDCSSPGALWEVFLLMSCFGHSYTEWCMCTELFYCKYYEIIHLIYVNR